MRHVKLTDDELWRAIAQNTEEMSALVHQSDADSRTGVLAAPCAGSRSYSEAVNKFEREYQDYVAEIRRRYLSPKKKPTVTAIEFGIVAALVSVVIIGVLSRYVH